MSLRFLLTAGFVAALLGGAPVLTAAEKPKPIPAPPTEKAPDPGKAPASGKANEATRVPFHGKVTAIDPAGKSFSLKGAAKDRVFEVTSKTVILNQEERPAKLADIPVGEEVRGSALKEGDVWTAQKVYIGAKEAAPAKKK